MLIWQAILFYATAGLAVGCLYVLCRNVEKLTKAVMSVRSELTKINSKLERIEAVSGDDTSLEAMEAAFAGFEKLKRVEATEP